MRLRPFFSYYGAKWRLAREYPQPSHKAIVEPFAGSACYSLLYPDRDVVLVDKDPTIAGVWRYLIGATEEEILDLPDLGADNLVRSLQVPQAARDLIGFWCSRGTQAPRASASAWMRSGIQPRSFWGPHARSRIASQLVHIRHWTVIRGDYRDLPNGTATWFVDPPYQDKGSHYRCGSRALDYAHLGDWCIRRKGQVIACEGETGAWLPFQDLGMRKSSRGQALEKVWVSP